MSVPPGQMAPPPGNVNGADPDTEQYETLVAGITEHIYSDAVLPKIQQQLKQSQDLPKDIGSLTLSLIMAGADQANQAGQELGLDVLMGAATEVIDSFIKIAEASGVDTGNLDDLREASLYAALEAYGTLSTTSPEEQDAAKQMLAQMQQDGTVQSAADHLQQRGQQVGVSPPAPRPSKTSLMGA